MGTTSGEEKVMKKNINHNKSRKISQKNEPKNQRMNVEPSLPLGAILFIPLTPRSNS